MGNSPSTPSNEQSSRNFSGQTIELPLRLTANLDEIIPQIERIYFDRNKDLGALRTEAEEAKTQLSKERKENEKLLAQLQEKNDENKRLNEAMQKRDNEHSKTFQQMSIENSKKAADERRILEDENQTLKRSLEEMSLELQEARNKLQKLNKSESEVIEGLRIEALDQNWADAEISAEISDDKKAYAIECANQATSNVMNTTYGDIARSIKGAFENKYGGDWTCIVLRVAELGYIISHVKNHSIELVLEELRILLFKTQNKTCDMIKNVKASDQKFERINVGKMTDQQQRRAKECAKEALKTKTNFLAIAKHIKDQFSASYGEGWSCIVSEYGTSECRYSPTAQFIELQIGELIKIDLFKSQQE